VVALGLLVVALLPPDGPIWPIMAALALCGLGFGSFQAPNNRTMLANAPRHRAGSAGGMQSTARVLGQAAGTVIVAMVFHVSAHGNAESIALGALYAAAAVAGVASAWAAGASVS
jgi:DHA2 family multidrug resistance protein-like MFS transporter